MACLTTRLISLGSNQWEFEFVTEQGDCYSNFFRKINKVASLLHPFNIRVYHEVAYKDELQTDSQTSKSWQMKDNTTCHTISVHSQTASVDYKLAQSSSKTLSIWSVPYPRHTMTSTHLVTPARRDTIHLDKARRQSTVHW